MSKSNNNTPWKKQRNELGNSGNVYKKQYQKSYANGPLGTSTDDAIVIEDSGSMGNDKDDEELDELMDTFVFTLEQIISAMLRKYNQPNK